MSTTMNTDNLITTIYTEDAKGNATLNGKPIERPDGLIMIGSDNPVDGPFNVGWLKNTVKKTIATTKTYDEARTIKKEIEKVQQELYEKHPPPLVKSQF